MTLLSVRSSLTLVIVLAASPLLVIAQDAAIPAISTDRPTVGYSPDIIPGGSVQVESGFQANVQRRGSVLDLPESLIRLGFYDRFELRFQASDVLFPSAPAPGSNLAQTSDIVFSSKFAIAKANSPGPRSAVVTLSIPTGAPEQTSGSYDPGVTLIWTQSFPRGYSINELASANLTTLAGARRPAWGPSIAGGKALTAKASLFVECAPAVTQSGAVVWTFDGGLTFLRHSTQQIDLKSGYLKDSAGVHTLLSIGFSTRRDNLLSLLKPPPITQ